MKSYLLVALLGSALMLAAYAVVQKLNAEQLRNEHLTKELKFSRNEVVKIKALALELQAILNIERNLQIDLQQSQELLSSQLTHSKIMIERLKRENQELSDWAANQLPTVVKRLRERPAITGAADYQNWLSSRNSLHPERNEPTE